MESGRHNDDRFYFPQDIKAKTRYNDCVNVAGCSFTTETDKGILTGKNSVKIGSEAI
jgi:hypothetical protein